MTLHVRTTTHPETVRTALLAILQDPQNPFVAADLKSFATAQQDAFGDVKATLHVTGAVALASLILSACGTWFLTRQWVDLRRKEICIRLAIGAPPVRLVGALVTHSAVLATIGVTIGGVIVFLLLNHYHEHIPGLDDQGISVFAIITGVTLLLGILASYVPALRVLKMRKRPRGDLLCGK
ncbi:MAG: hypothetical protein J6386_13580 [Candidatus Synoicihabitans palmerolidicus]|nr:hypothetical protein [Candidatus Synoicihabitans palmerolidicus]